MKKRILLMGVLAIFCFYSSSSAKILSSHECQGMEGSLLDTAYEVCIDPGHGGPLFDGGSKYGSNGDGYGTQGTYLGLTEQWAALTVSFLLKDLISQGNSELDIPSQAVVMTRYTQVTPAAPPAGWWHRIQTACYGCNGMPVYENISQHFNGLPPNTTQGCETWISDNETTDSGFVRNTDPKLARKVNTEQHLWLNLMYPHNPLNYEDRGGAQVNNSIFVLRQIWGAAVCLTEPFDITYHPSDEIGLDDSCGYHAAVTAFGEYLGWCSYYTNSGFITIENRAIGGGGMYITITFPNGQVFYAPSPYKGVALKDEVWNIGFVLYLPGNPQQPFHCYYRLECGETVVACSTEMGLTYTVPECSTHTIIAYYSGGPYDIDLNYPDGGEVWWVCEPQTIAWKCSSGCDSTSKVDILISRDGGSTWESIATNIPFNRGYSGGYSHYTWLVTGVSEHCRIKVVAHDIAGNEAEEVSNEFAIRFLAQVIFPNSGEVWDIGEQAEISWIASGGEYTRVDIWLSYDGGYNWQLIAENIRNDYYSFKWTPTGQTSEHCKIKIRAYKGTDEAFGVSDGEFAIRYYVWFKFPYYENTPMCAGWAVSPAFFWVSPGVGQNHLSVFIDRNDGRDGYTEELTSFVYNTKYWVCLYWWIIGPASDSCRFKVVASDDAGHTATAISSRFRIITDCIIGDVNLNGKFYDAGDAIMLARVVIFGPSAVFWDSLQWEASDANCDGRGCMLADLIYLCKVLAGDVPPCELWGWTGGSGKITTETGTVSVTASYSYNDNKTTVSITSSSPIAGLLIEIENQAGNPVVFSMGKMENMASEEKVLMYDNSGGAKSIPAGTHELFTVEDNVELKSVSAVDPWAREMKTEIFNEADYSSLPSDFALHHAYPNPFNPNTNLSFTLPNASAYSMRIYNVAGQLVRSYGGIGSVGLNMVTWDGTDDYSNGVASGIYFYKLKAGDFSSTKKMVLLR